MGSPPRARTPSAMQNGPGSIGSVGPTGRNGGLAGGPPQPAASPQSPGRPEQHVLRPTQMDQRLTVEHQPVRSGQRVASKLDLRSPDLPGRMMDLGTQDA